MGVVGGPQSVSQCKAGTEVVQSDTFAVAGLAVVPQLAAGFPFILVATRTVEIARQSMALSFILARVRGAWVFLHLRDRGRQS